VALGFHSGNGSEFINQRVSELLNELLIEQTKPRPRHSNDNGLVESKNGAVIRKHMGYLHIQAEHAGAIHDFYRDLNPYRLDDDVRLSDPEPPIPNRRKEPYLVPVISARPPGSSFNWNMLSIEW
jgi:hypothetical protein